MGDAAVGTTDDVASAVSLLSKLKPLAGWVLAAAMLVPSSLNLRETIQTGSDFDKWQATQNAAIDAARVAIADQKQAQTEQRQIIQALSDRLARVELDTGIMKQSQDETRADVRDIKGLLLKAGK